MLRAALKRGNSESLKDIIPQNGNIYYCINNSTLYFDYEDDNGVIQRQPLNAEDSQSLSGAYLSTSLNPSDQEIPTSNTIIENTVLLTPQELTIEEQNQVRQNLRFIGKNVAGQEFTIDDETVVAGDNAEIFGDYENNIAVGKKSIAEGSSTIAKGNYSHAEGVSSKAFGEGSHVEGYGTQATGYYSHAEGELTVVSSYASHAEGSYTTMPDGTKRYGTASGYASHVEGGGSHATGAASHAEGIGTTAAGYYSHTEGFFTTAAGNCQHVEGKLNVEDPDSTYIHIAGNGTSLTDRSNAYTLDWGGNGWFAGKVTANGTIENDNDVITKKYAEDNFAKLGESGDVVLDGEIKADNVPHIVEEVKLCTIPAATLQEALTNGVKRLTIDAFEHDPNIIVYATYGGKEYVSFENEENYLEFFVANPYVTDGFACGFTIGQDADGNVDETKAVFNYRVLDTENVTDLVLTQLVVSTIDSKYFDHDFTIINSISMNRRGDIGTYSTALGGSCVASGNSSFSTGLACEATGAFSTAVGKGTFATGEAGLSTGLMTTAGREAFATGRYSEATGRGSLATGNTTKASGQYSYAEGSSTIASKTGAHTEGFGTLASSDYQHVQGKYNVEDISSIYAHIVGNGTSGTARSNAHTIGWNGDAWFKGDVYVGSTSGVNKDEGSKKLATEAFVEGVVTWGTF